MSTLGTGPFSKDSDKTRRPGKWAAAGPIVLAAVFLLALVLAANHNDVLGWVIVVVAFGWLVLATFVYIGVYKAAKFGADQVRTAQAHLAAAGSARQGSGAPESGAGTRLLNDDSGNVRDLKLDHSFKIIQVQAGVLEDGLGHGAAAIDRDKVDRALETIRITAHNGRGMIGVQVTPAAAGTGSSRTNNPAGDDGEPVRGVVID
ncbi:hypothetical protein IV498_07575 [Paenarthrobacter sp. Z7-10]|uniref:hypothetical protein n=1 Tax=Paenarthrobacter sp. Z7-10 TaxID=2787635 RepID=UPI0022A96708|nr:hypothetical protein [Paenarthrobacter sp. Z7-10]MCZ2403045.1 hypothetical protein [Paenarthrobacter sp. Z7-10]